VLILYNLISEDCGMGVAVNSFDCFSIKRLVRDFGNNVSSDSSLGTLSIAGKVSVEDVFLRITKPHSYRMNIVKSMFLKRGDINVVMVRLLAMMKDFEVIPAVYVYPNTHQKL